MEDQLCAECQRPLSEDEAIVCEDCAITLLPDPNYDMTGGENG